MKPFCQLMIDHTHVNWCLLPSNALAVLTVVQLRCTSVAHPAGGIKLREPVSNYELLHRRLRVHSPWGARVMLPKLVFT